MSIENKNDVNDSGSSDCSTARTCECGLKPQLHKRHIGAKWQGAYVFHVRCKCGRHTEESTAAGDAHKLWESNTEIYGRTDDVVMEGTPVRDRAMAKLTPEEQRALGLAR